MRALPVVLCLVAGNAYAEDFVKSSKSGQPTLMHVYRSWNKDCTSNIGVVKVLSKPLHGTLKPSHVTSTIGTSRRNPERTEHCRGKSTDGFRVDYTSALNFRGTDHFQIQFSYGKRNTDIDNFTVNVQ